MAVDQSVMEAVGRGASPPTIRFYGFRPPCLSIGRFQPLSHVNREACLSLGIDLVRRPTGGRALLHREDFTYMVALPLELLPASVEESYTLICRGIVKALRELGIKAGMATRPRTPGRDIRACFTVPASADLTVGGKKICGSAQTRAGGALLQHGTILRRRDTDLLLDLLVPEGKPEEEVRAEFEESCIGLEELGSEVAWGEIEEAMVSGFSGAFNVRLIPDSLTEEEKERSEYLLEVYSSEEWCGCVL